VIAYVMAMEEERERDNKGKHQGKERNIWALMTDDKYKHGSG
jgi:hypothetical protein